MVGLAAVSAATGAVDTGFDNQLSGGIGVNGTLGVRAARSSPTTTPSCSSCTPAGRSTARTATASASSTPPAKQLLPWRTRLWDDNLPFVGGIQRIYARRHRARTTPTSWCRAADRVATGRRSATPRSPSRSTAATDDAAAVDLPALRQHLLGRHHREGRLHRWALQLDRVAVGTRPVAGPGQRRLRHRPGPVGLRPRRRGRPPRPHAARSTPLTARRWSGTPASNSFEGNKAMEATSRGLHHRRRRHVQGRRAHRPRRVLRLQHGVRPPRASTRRSPPRSRAASWQPASSTCSTGTATAPGGAATGPGRDPGPGHQPVPPGRPGDLEHDQQQHLRHPRRDLGADRPPGRCPLTFTGNRNLQVMAKAFATSGASDPVKAVKKFETFSFDDQTPSTNITGPGGTVLNSTTFTVTGTATDDKGVNALTCWVRDENLRYLQDDGTVSSTFNTFRDRAGRHRGHERDLVVGGHRAVRGHLAGVRPRRSTRPDSRTSGGVVRDWTVTSSGVAPTVTLTSPQAVTPPTAALADDGRTRGQRDFRRHGQGRPAAQERRDPAAQLHDRRGPRRRRLLGRGRHAGLVPGLAAQPVRDELQLELHDALHARAGHLLLHRARHGQPGPQHVRIQPGASEHQRPRYPTTPSPTGCWTSPARSRPCRCCTWTSPEPRRTTSASPRSSCRCETATPVASCSPTARCRARSPHFPPLWRPRAGRAPRGPCP